MVARKYTTYRYRYTSDVQSVETIRDFRHYRSSTTDEIMYNVPNTIISKVLDKSLYKRTPFRDGRSTPIFIPSETEELDYSIFKIPVPGIDQIKDQAEELREDLKQRYDKNFCVEYKGESKNFEDINKLIGE